MAEAISITAEDLARDASRFSEIIDVRSPSEFAEDAVEGSVNLPVMDDDERATIGSIYKQESRFKARRLGGAIVAEHAAALLRGHFAEKPGSYFPLVYCWRGGMRSNSLATILSAVGWRVALLEGGYKAYRGEIVRWFKEDLESAGFHFFVVAGLTGSAKTHVLRALRDAGEQVLDLEGLANHRGSLLGSEPGFPQPGQRRFEGLLRAAIARFDPGRAVFVESESNRIGALQVPPVLWHLLKSSPVVELQASVVARREFLIRTYPHFTGDPEALIAKLSFLRQLHGAEKIGQWAALARSEDWPVLVDSLLVEHYDPAYRRSHAKHFRDAMAVVEAESLGEDAVAEVAERVRQAVAGCGLSRE